MKYYLIILSFLFAVCVNTDLTGQVTFEEDPSINKIMTQWVTMNRSEEDIRGWRIQIITTSDRREMDKAMARFNDLYPDHSMEWKHVVPYYKVLVGAYEEKNKLMGFLLKLKEDFPSVIPVMADIPKDHFIRL